MNVFQQVREVESGEDSGSAARIARARTQMMREVGSAPRRSPKARRVRVWGGVGLGGAVGVTAAIVAATVLAPATVGSVKPDPAVAAVVNQLADLTLTAEDAQMEPGQYFRVTKYGVTISLWSSEFGYSDSTSWENADAGVTSQSEVVMYVPAERSDDWIIEGKDPAVTGSYGDPAALEGFELAPGAKDFQGLESRPGGRSDERDWFMQAVLAEADTLPRDPEALLGWVYAFFTDDTPENQAWMAFNVLSSGFDVNVLPADLRAAFLRAHAFIPYLTVADEADGKVAIEWRSSESSNPGWGATHVQSIVIDTTTGYVVAYTDAYPDRDSTIVPSDVPWYEIRYEMSVVDEAPTP